MEGGWDLYLSPHLSLGVCSVSISGPGIVRAIIIWFEGIHSLMEETQILTCIHSGGFNRPGDMR